VPNILSVCKAEEGSDAATSLADTNAAGNKVGGAESVIVGRVNHRSVFEKCFLSDTRHNLREIEAK